MHKKNRKQREINSRESRSCVICGSWILLVLETIFVSIILASNNFSQYDPFSRYEGKMFGIDGKSEINYIKCDLIEVNWEFSGNYYDFYKKMS